MSFEELYKLAFALTGLRQLSHYASCAEVGSAILTEGGNVYTGINIDTACSLGFCAEHSAAAAMLAAGESRIKKVIAVDSKGKILPPCGRCREFLCQIDVANIYAEVMIKEDKVCTLRELLPFDWQFRWE